MTETERELLIAIADALGNPWNQSIPPAQREAIRRLSIEAKAEAIKSSVKSPNKNSKVPE